MIHVAPACCKIRGAFVDGSLAGGKSKLEAASLEVTSKSMSNLQSRTEGGKVIQILGRAETRKEREA